MLGYDTSSYKYYVVGDAYIIFEEKKAIPRKNNINTA